MGKGFKDLLKLVIVIVVLCLLVYLYPEENPEIKKQMYFGVVGGGVAAFRIVSLSFVLAAASITNSVTFGALGRGTASMIMSLIRQLCVLLPVALVLALVFRRVESVWWSFLIAEFVAFAYSFIMLKRIWKKDVAHLPDGASV